MPSAEKGKNMKTKVSVFNKVLSLFMVVCMLVSFVNVVREETSALEQEEYYKVSDPSTMDGWQSIFGENVHNTSSVGAVWTDKSVFATADEFAKYGIEINDPNSFLVALSVIASNKSVSGLSTVPTDTMLVLDISSSMYPGGDPSVVSTMVSAVNSTVSKLQTINIYNRVGVSIYFGGDTLWGTSANSSMVLLPLGRYSHSSNQYLKVNTNGNTFSGVSVNSGVTNEKGQNVSATHNAKSVAATYAQLGILDALDQFMRPDIDTVIPADAEYLAGVTRVPVLVLMSDGEPTAATNNYTSREDSKMGNNQVTNRNPEETDFVTQLTAAYAKEKIDARYVETEPIFYTLSLGNSISIDLMDPVLADKQAAEGVDATKANNNKAIREYWDSLVKYGTINITVENYRNGSFSIKDSATYQVKKITLNGKAFPDNTELRFYVDEAFTAATADSLANAFESIVEKIALQSRYFPTLVEGNEDLSGYVTFVDVMGDYMEVHNIKGIIVGDKLFSGADLSSNFVDGGGKLGTYDAPTELGLEFVRAVQQRFGIPDMALAEALIGQAYSHGQLSYTSPTEFSNYIGWYANAKEEFLGFWHEGIETMPNPNDPNLSEDERPVYIMRCYGYLGAMDEEHGINKSDMMYTIVQVRESIQTGDETVKFSVPAALVPMVYYDISLDEKGNATEFSISGAKSPMRLVYEVGLKEGIDGITVTDPDVVDGEYVAANTDKNGAISFYTNKYMVDGSMGYGLPNAFSYFRPSHQNERYYYTENSIVCYSDGTPYTGETAPSADGDFYRAEKIYSHKDSVSVETVYHKISSAVISVARKGEGGKWYIPKGSVIVELEGKTTYKNPDNTNTLKDVSGRGLVYVPFVDIEGHHVDETEHSFVVGATLGNNGLLKIVPSTGIKISKTVSGTYEGDPSFEFVVSAEGVNGEFETRSFSKDGKITDGHITFKNGYASVNLKDGESVIITGLEAGKTYTVKETETVEYMIRSINGKVGAREAKLIPEHGKIAEANVINSVRGKGNLTVTKTVKHNLGDTYVIPEDKSFNVSITLSGVGTKNATFEASHSGDSSITSLTTDENGVFPVITLKNDEQIQINNLPIETVAIVEEITPPVGFTPTYKENGANGDGIVAITSSIASVEIINAYEYNSVSGNEVSISGTKYLNDENGKAVENWGNAEFVIAFEEFINGSWKELERATVNSENRTFSFELSSEVFTKPGVYSYQIYEVVPSAENRIDGMLYDPVYHTFSVVVTDKDMDGKLEISRVHSEHAEKDFEKGEGGKWEIVTDFTNIQHVTSPAVVHIPVQKELINNSLSSLVNLAGYEFGLYTNEECTVPAVVGNGLESMDVPPTDGVGEGLINLVFNAEGEYTYYIKEKSGGIVGMTYDAKVVRVDIRVTGGVGGELEAETTFSENPINGELVFTNIYDVTKATVELDVRKILEGRPLTSNDVFTFEVLSNGETVLKGQNNASGKVAFNGVLEFTKVGVYEYTVVETSESGNGITVDDTEYTVKVTVTDGGNGALVASVSVLEVVGETMTFVNKYSSKQAEYVLTGTKELNGRALLNDEFIFVMEECNAEGIVEGDKSYTARNFTNGSFAFEKLTFTKEGVFHYLVSEKADTTLGGIKYDESKYILTLNVVDNQMGALTVSASFKTQGGKQVNGIVFVNEYVPSPTKALIPGVKIFNGKVLGEGQFSFELYESNSNWDMAKLLETVKNSKDGKITFSEIEYDKAGTYYYLVKEAYDVLVADGITYDDTVYRVKVVVSDDLKGMLHADVQIFDEENNKKNAIEFVNTYEISQGKDVVISGVKYLDGRELKDGEFTFLLKNENGEILQRVSNTNGAFSFRISYTGKDAGKVFEYTVSEEKGTLGGITYDEGIYNVKVTVSDNGVGGVETALEITQNGNAVRGISFTNTYKATPADVELSGNKTLVGKDLAGGQFSFELYSATEEYKEISQLQTAFNNENGSFAFESLTFNNVGTYYYIVREVGGGKTENGITYDSAVYNVEVKVSDNLEGALEATVAIYLNNEEKTSIDFVNEYGVSGEDSVVIKGEKTLNGRELKDGEFSFELKDENGNVVKTATNENGKFEFVLSFTGEDAGNVYNYTISEVNNGLGGITYDNSVYNVKVTVSDNGNGGIDATEEITKNGASVEVASFVNSYDANSVKVVLNGNKYLEGRDLVDGEFTFLLYATDESFNIPEGATPVITTNKADGSFEFAEIIFDSEGTYYFVVAESDDSDAERITFDSTIYNVSVVITDNGEGELVASQPKVSKKDGAETDGALVFNNVFTPKPDDITATITVDKTIISEGDKTITPEGFEFVLENLSNGEKTALRTDEFGKAIFNLTFTEDDIGKVYEYKLTETNEGMANITYSTAVYNIVISVTLDSDNRIKAEITKNGVAEAEVICSFENTFTPPPKPGDLSLSAFWVVMLVLSSLGFVSCVAFERKRRNA